jgi:hypothetical protein
VDGVRVLRRDHTCERAGSDAHEEVDGEEVPTRADDRVDALAHERSSASDAEPRVRGGGVGGSSKEGSERTREEHCGK